MRFIPISLLLAAGALSCFGQVQFVQQSDRVVVRVNGQDFTELRFGKDVHKPYLYPLRTASGKVITRGFPFTPQPGEDTAAYHQVGLWVGHERVSGVDYFEVDPRWHKNRPTGSVVFKDVTAAAGGVHEGVLAFVNEWVHPDGDSVITERRAFRFYADAKDSRMIDVEFRLHANRKVELTDHADCVLGLRLGKAFEERNAGTVKDFLGREGAAALNGRRSLWIGYEAAIDGEKVGVTIMDHPDNYGYPTRWRVDTRGFAFASAFAEKAFYPRDKTPPPTVKDMGVTLQPGDEMVFRYRVLIHPVWIDRQACWRQFALAPASNLTAGDAPALAVR
jgi:hypothetical protein